MNIFTPIQLATVTDKCLPEGRVMVTATLDFSKNQTTSPDGTKTISEYRLSSGSFPTGRLLSAIKGLCGEFFTTGQNLMRVFIQETGQEFFLGNNTVGSGEQFITNFKFELLAPANCTIVIQGICGVGVTNTDYVRIIVTNFEVGNFVNTTSSTVTIPIH